MSKRQTASAVDRETLLAQAALKLLEKQAWGRITIASIARAAKLPLQETIALAPSKTAVVGIILRVFANETAKRHSAEPASREVRERVFDVIMTWFDVQQPHAAALKKLYRVVQYDPATLLALRADILRVSAELLVLAEADFGFSACIQSAMFVGILVRAVAVWRDDDAEMGKTMAQLDADLRRVERFLWPKPGTAGVPPASKAKKSGRVPDQVGDRGPRKKSTAAKGL
jgi:AcrR family transcriptional regulator